jgi:hypothetical protein
MGNFSLIGDKMDNKENLSELLKKFVMHENDVCVQKIIDANGNSTNTYILTPFKCNTVDGYQADAKSAIMKFVLTVDPATHAQTLTFMCYARCGNNYTSFVPHDNKLYLCPSNEMLDVQSNAAIEIYYIDVCTPATAAITINQVVVPDLTPTGDFCDISFIDDNQVYILVRHLDSGHATTTLTVYQTSVTNLLSTSPTAWTAVIK